MSPLADALRRSGARVSTVARRLPWKRMAALYAVVTIGFSQIVFNLILENHDYFPGGSWFYFWVLVWVQALPFAVLVAAEGLILRLFGTERVFRAWRAALYTALFLSFLRQCQIHYPQLFTLVLERIPVLPLILSLSALVFLLCIRSRLLVHQYFAYLGAIALVLTGLFVARSGTFSRPWSGAGGDPGLEARAGVSPPIVLILFDELSYDVLARNGSIDATTFPNFAALAEDSAWFTRATTNHQMTLEAVPTMLSGYLHPPDVTRTLFDRLPRGYDAWISTGATPCYRWLRRHVKDDHRLLYSSRTETMIRGPLEIPGFLAATLAETPISRSPFQPQPARRLLPPDLWAGASITLNHREEIRTFLTEIDRATERPRFLFWHCWFPHFPFTLDADGRTHDRPHVAFRSADFWFEGRVDPASYSPEAVWKNYREQVRYVDSLLGGIVDRLRKSGLYRRSVLIVTSDHGLRTYGEMEPEGHPRVLGNLTPRVPLFIRGPGVTPGRYDVDYQHVDLVATLLDVLGIPETGRDTEGISAFSAERPDREKVFEIFVRGPRRRYVYDREADVWRLREQRP